MAINIRKQKGFFTGLGAALAGGALSFLGGERSNEAQVDQANQANAISVEEARKNRVFQRQMSNTAHRREARDLKEAGLNRILTVARGSGASTASGAAATGQQADIKDTLSPAVANASQIARANAEIQLQKAQTEKTKAEKATTEARTREIEGETEPAAVKVQEIKQVIKNLTQDEFLKRKERAIKQIEIGIKTTVEKSEIEKLEQLKTRMVEMRTKEKFYQQVGTLVQYTKTVVTGIAGLTAIGMFWKAFQFSPAARVYKYGKKAGEKLIYTGINRRKPFKAQDYDKQFRGK